MDSNGSGIEGKTARQPRERGNVEFQTAFRLPAFLLGKPGRCFASVAACEIFLIRSFANHRPNVATPDVDDGGNSDREVYNVSSTAPRGGEPRANARSDANRLGGDARNSTGNTIGTSRADHPDESSPCAAIPIMVATR